VKHNKVSVRVREKGFIMGEMTKLRFKEGGIGNRRE